MAHSCPQTLHFRKAARKTLTLAKGAALLLFNPAAAQEKKSKLENSHLMQRIRSGSHAIPVDQKLPLIQLLLSPGWLGLKYNNQDYTGPWKVINNLRAMGESSFK